MRDNAPQPTPEDHDMSAQKVTAGVQCVRRIQFCAGHRVWKHESKCAYLHGHNYVAYFYATAASLDALGRVIDFSVLKARLGSWIEENWDHGFILNGDDVEAIRLLKSIPGQRVYLMSCNPTAENMALHLLNEIGPQQMRGTGVTLIKVVLWETENSFVEASL